MNILRIALLWTLFAAFFLQAHGLFYGMCYTPFRRFGVCPTDAEVEADVQILLRHTTRVRLYSTECRNVNNILLKHASQGSLSVLLGVYVDNRPTDQQEVDYLMEALAAYPHARIEGVVVGNEVMYRNTMPKRVLIQRIHEVRDKVRRLAQTTGNESYRTAPIYAVEIFPDAEIGGASDILGLNIHPFYRPDLVDDPDPEVMANRILEAAKQQIEIYRSVLPHKRIVVTEIGWPTQSDRTEQHRGDPVIALKFYEKFKAYSGQAGIETYWFELFDSPWKIPMFPNNELSMSEFNFGLYKADRTTIKTFDNIGGCQNCGNFHHDVAPVYSQTLAQAPTVGGGAAFSEATAQGHSVQSQAQAHAQGDNAFAGASSFASTNGGFNFAPVQHLPQPYRKLLRV